MRLSLFLGLLLLALPAMAAELSSLRVVVEGNRVAITYDLEADQSAPVAVKGSEDGGRTWNVKMDHVVGDVGEAVRPGRGKVLTWEVLRDYPRGYGVRGVVFELTTSGGDFVEPVTGMEFVWVEGGCFQMGSPPSESGRRGCEGPVHGVCVDGFYMGKTEVTNAQYRKFRSSHDSKDYEGHSLNGATQPVVYVGWEDAMAFAKWLSGKTGRRYRLPTEAEWEYAARAGTNAARYWGEDPDHACSYANFADQSLERTWPRLTAHNTAHDCDDGYEVTAPVGSFKPNGFGLYDMLGNVEEWCSDRYDGQYYSKSPRQNPQGPSWWSFFSTGGSRGLRGGDWRSVPDWGRSASRNAWGGGGSSWDIGFRLVLDTPD